MAEAQISFSTMLMTYIAFSVMIIIGHIRDQIGKIFTPWNYKMFYENNGIPPVYTTLESFFIRRLYTRICDCWNRPITGRPGKMLSIKERVSPDYNETFRQTGKDIRALNFGSYNYLGFADAVEDTLDACLSAVDSYPVNYAFPAAEGDRCKVVKDLERELANFIGTEDSIVFSMGFGTNTWALSALVSDSLVLSDVYNHTSIINGLKLTNAFVSVFKHNSMADLESKLRFHISQGMPETHRAWKRIFVVVEGVYSMEGTMVKLERLVELKKKYGFYIFMDEAHSIGAIGKTGRGVCEYFQISPKEVDVLMGTFSKSFNAAGGYIAGSKALIRHLQENSDGWLYAEQLSPVLAAQILASLRRIIAEPERVARLLENTRYLRRGLRKLSLQTLGDPVSPVVPFLICSPGKLGTFSRMCLDLHLAVVVVGYPATPVLRSRVRLCVSAAHTKEDIDKALEIIDGISRVLGLSQ